MPAVTEDMIVDQVDGNDRPIGVLRRAEVFRRRANFRVAHDLVFNSRGQLLIQELAATRSRHPGYWGSSVAGYLFSGESYEAAARRRLSEELGITPLNLEYVGRTTMADDGCFKFIAVFKTVSDGPFNFDRGHISAIEFVAPSDIRKLQAEGSHLFTPTFLQVLAFYQNR